MDQQERLGFPYDDVNLYPVWPKYSNLLSHWKLRLYCYPRFGLSSAPLLSITQVATY